MATVAVVMAMLVAVMANPLALRDRNSGTFAREQGKLLDMQEADLRAED